MAKRKRGAMTKQRWAWIKALKVPKPRILWDKREPYSFEEHGPL